MSSDNRVDGIIEALKDIKLELKIAIVNSKLLSYLEKIHLLVKHKLGDVEWCIQEVEDIIPKTIEKYQHLRKKGNYMDYGYEKYQTIYLDTFAENLIEDFDYLKIDISEEDKEEIVEEVFYYIRRTSIIGFKYDW